ncbi:hypothetical protein E2P81_ATG04926 [Venturia nashicola]|uniref:Uncharacterized protein n=1 Tax=Venturia nashicola TaxID=86259 RepID=A0A4Z1NZH5_9PEZI|nr:hypothetical protein E6O75_ATG05053 [Venturia nashicola]TLD34761.1 hypothetical protein E2P81_ATG04926 [Venturia nashicola]
MTSQYPKKPPQPTPEPEPAHQQSRIDDVMEVQPSPGPQEAQEPAQQERNPYHAEPRQLAASEWLLHFRPW